MTQITKTALLTTPACLVCDSPTGLKLVKDRFNVRQCIECDFLFVHPMPSDEALADHYELDYRQATADWYPKHLDRRWRALTRSASFMPYAFGKDVVDLGCGGGQMLDALARFAKTAVGVDLSKNSIAFARRHFPKYQFFDESLEVFAKRGQRFDFVFSSELLEHLPGPHEFMKTLLAITRPAAIVYVSAPDAGHKEVPHPMRRWSDICPPEHLQWFNEHNLNLLFEKYGFAPVKRVRSSTPAHSAFFKRMM